MNRGARALRRRYRILRHRGDAVCCPICGGRFDRFMDDWNRAEALCWRCGSHERHRALWLFLTDRRPELLARARTLLHFAPEWCLEGRLAAQGGYRYLTADLHPDRAALQLDVTDLELEDGSVDAVICSHVLEHIPDDARAMSELRRVLARDGWCVVMVPVDHGAAATYEDPAVVTPEERQRAYWQHDHVRLYGMDVGDRLAAAGFAVVRVSLEDELGYAESRRLGLSPADLIWLCT